MVPALAVAPNATVPEPQVLPDVTPDILGKALTVTVEVPLNVWLQVPLVTETNVSV